MDRKPASDVLREIQTLYRFGTLSGLTDSQLLDRFLAQTGDETEDAFAALVHRHGPMVEGVCRRMLRTSHDAEDAFQATFLVLARRAASIGRREQLASWLYGVAVRTAKEARRRAARQRAIELQLTNFPSAESEQGGDQADLASLLDDELSRLPERYRSALVACELEGKSRREAAGQLGIPEGTLSTHLARGRKLLHARLLRRGVALGVGHIAGVSIPPFDPVFHERLLEPAIRAAMSLGPKYGAAGTISHTVISLGERVIKMMFRAKLGLLVSAFVTASAAIALAALAWPVLAGAPPHPDQPKAGADELVGRVVDDAGAGVANVQVWGMSGDWFAPDVVARATTDDQGRYQLPDALHLVGQPGRARGLSLFARARDGRVGWQHPGRQIGGNVTGGEIQLQAVDDVRGRLVDQDDKPIVGVEVAPAAMTHENVDYVWLSPAVRDLFRTTTAADGSFVLRGIAQGAGVHAAIAAPKFGSPIVSWHATQSVAITLDSRLGRIKGRIRPPDGRSLDRSFSLALKPVPNSAAPPRPFEVRWSGDTSTAPDGTFQFDALPPGRYKVSAYFDQDGIIAEKPETEVEVKPGGLGTVEVALQRQLRITGRVVDARTGQGVAGIRLRSLWRERESNLLVGEATTDADGKYTVRARPGTSAVQIAGLPTTFLVQDGVKLSEFQINSDKVLPDLKLIPAAKLSGIVVDRAGHPVPEAEVYFLMTDRPGVRSAREPLRTAVDGTFHLDQLSPDQTVGLWARAGDATTNGTTNVQPEQANVTLAVDPKNTARLSGRVTDSRGGRVANAKVSLWWTRWYPPGQEGRATMATSSVQAPYTTGNDGRFAFDRLWPKDSYQVVVEAQGHKKGEPSRITGKPGDTNDFGTIVLANADAYLAGQVVGSDGRPVVGAQVFNRGDAPAPIETATDAQGRFRLNGFLAGPRFVFVRKEGYRFTGVKMQGDSVDMKITLLKAAEPPPAWKPRTLSDREQERTFAKDALNRIWQKYSTKADTNGALSCIPAMAEFDPDLAAQWSAAKGHRYDGTLRFITARKLAETNVDKAIELLNQKPNVMSQVALLDLVDQVAMTVPTKALRIAQDAAAQARRLKQPDRAVGMAHAGAALVKLGRSDLGRAIIDEAVRDAAELPAADRGGYSRGVVAGVLAPYDLQRALALIAPVETANQIDCNRARIAVAIAKTDTRRAVELVESVGGVSFYHELARTAIAYQIGGDRPDEAIKIIEDMKRGVPTIWQAEAFGWLAVALAPRDQARANALIDRALDMMIFDRDPYERSASSGGEMAGAAHVALCARRIGYPDMDSVIMRVIAARPIEGQNASADRTSFAGAIAVSTVFLALLDPDAARTVLDQLEARARFDLAAEWSTLEPWLKAWALVDLEKARNVFEAGLKSLDQRKEVNLWGTGVFNTVELLTAPPERRESILGGRFGGAYWRPDQEF